MTLQSICESTAVCGLNMLALTTGFFFAALFLRKAGNMPLAKATFITAIVSFFTVISIWCIFAILFTLLK